MKPLFLLLPLAMAITGCATVTRGTTEAFLIETEPSGANVSTSLGLSCTPTPCAIPKVKREAEFSVTIEKEGYKTTTHNITHQMSGGGGAGMAGNVILGGGIGAILDANNGATQELVPNPLKVTLEKLPEDTTAKAEVATKLEELTDDQPAS